MELPGQVFREETPSEGLCHRDLPSGHLPPGPVAFMLGNGGAGRTALGSRSLALRLVCLQPPEDGGYGGISLV